MKKIIISLLLCSIFQLGYAQKKELKTIDKQIKAGDYENALITLESISDLIETTDYKTKAKYYYLKGLANYQNGTGSLENKLLSITDFNKVKEIETIETKTRHDVIAFLTNVAKYVGPESRFIHKGLTSSDILDTSFSIQLHQSSLIIKKK